MLGNIWVSFLFWKSAKLICHVVLMAWGEFIQHIPVPHPFGAALQPCKTAILPFCEPRLCKFKPPLRG